MNNKVIMVAAASKGLGYGIARAAALKGASVSIASRSKEEIGNAAKMLREETGSKVSAFTFDAKEKDSIETWVESTLSEFHTIDGFVVNAGGPPAGSFDSFDDSDWQNAFELSLLSAVRMIRAVLPTMKRNSSGSIVTITSSSIREPIPSLLLSNVFRSGVASLVKSLSNELGEHNIRVNNLVPGRIDTDRVKELDRGLAKKNNKTAADIKEGFEKQIPLGRYGTADEFGNAGAFLLSDESSYITGSTLLVDGGKTESIW